jgi:hypothetical protein
MGSRANKEVLKSASELRNPQKLIPCISHPAPRWLPFVDLVKIAYRVEY